MIPRLFNRCLLRPEDVSATQDNLKVIGVFNPGAVQTQDGVFLLVRVAEAVAEQRPGYIALPQWDITGQEVVVEWLRERDVIFEDARVVIDQRSGHKRLTSVSHLVVVHCKDGRSVGAIGPTRFLPSAEYEEFGVEDPRITQLRDRFYVTYTAVSRHGVATALASTIDFKNFEREGIIFPPENKDVVLFPEQIDGRYVALHRPNPSQRFTPPEIWLATSPDLIHWGRHTPLLGAGGGWDVERVGAGAPPIRTEGGWLEIYHENSKHSGKAGVGRYSAGSLLLSLKDPSRILGTQREVLVPQADFEMSGFVPDVVFPTGMICREERVLLFYGAADTYVGVVEWRLRDLLRT